jgi:4-amino-4-deoxy-L-arabinose transferase-like glycosyltransferase
MIRVFRRFALNPVWLGAAVLFALTLVRLTCLGIPDLIDSTEGRYAAAALHMVELGDILVPWIRIEGQFEPYLGKPPLHFWLIAASFEVFGLSTAAARFPSFLTSCFTAGLVFWFLKPLKGAPTAMTATVILVSIPLFFFLGGACVLDTTLMLCVSAAFIALYHVVALGRQDWLPWTLLGAAIGLGVLTKGPVAIVFVAIPGLIWWWLYWRVLPKVGGAWRFSAYAIVVTAAPWYLAVEWMYPGFLWYFMVKENLLRFVADSYGDRYGTGHPQPLGTVWLHALIACFPWSLVAVWLTATRWSSFRIPKDPLAGLALCWFFVNMLFLTVTSQYTATYLSPLLPGAAIFLGLVLQQLSLAPRWSARYAWTAPVTAAVALIVAIVGVFLGAPLFVPILLVLGLVAAWRLRQLGGPRTTAAATILTGGGLAYLFLAVLLSMSPHVSMNRSSNQTLALLAAHAHQSGDTDVRIGYVGRVPFSVDVYRHRSGLEMTVVPLGDFPAPPQSDTLDYLVTAPDSLSDADAAKAGWTEIFQGEKLRMLARTRN